MRVTVVVQHMIFPVELADEISALRVAGYDVDRPIEQDYPPAVGSGGK